MASGFMQMVKRVAAALLMLLLLAGTARTVSGLLTDIAGHWSAPIIAALQARGVVSGDTQGRFQPDGPLTRAQMARMLVSALNNDANAQLLAGYPSRYTDLPPGHWARGFVESLAESGVTDGYPDGRFGPDDLVTRAQMAVFLTRAAGLSELARERRFERSPYPDDRELPDWARGSVLVALSQGLMTGFEDGSFRPNQPITRAEGGAAVHRLLAYRGSAYHMTGTLLQYDPDTRRGLLRDAVGQERPFEMALTAQYFRGGLPSAPRQIRPMDQAWIVLDPDGTGRFMDARFADLPAADGVLEGSAVRLGERTLRLQAGALLFLNGRPVSLAQLTGPLRLYLILDSQTGEVRVLDAVRVAASGLFLGADIAAGQIALEEESRASAYRTAPEALYFLNGEPVSVTALQPRDRVLLATNAEGHVIYLQAER